MRRRKTQIISSITARLTAILQPVDDLLAKTVFFADFKAVTDGNVWCIGKNLYQDTMDTGSIIHDFHEMLTSEDTDELTYMYKLK